MSDPTMTEIMGVQTEVSDLRQLLRAENNSTTKTVSTGEQHIQKLIPTKISEWVNEMYLAEDDEIPLYFKNLPDPNSELREFLTSKKIVHELTKNFRIGVWNQLEKNIPGWLNNNIFVVHEALLIRNTDVLDYLVDHYPSLIRNGLGLSPSEKNDGGLCIENGVIDTEQSIFNDESWGTKDFVSCAALRQIGEIWPVFNQIVDTVEQQENVSKMPWGDALKIPSDLTGAQRLVLLMNKDTEKNLARWLFTRVDELSEYIKGDSRGWERIIGNQANAAKKEAKTWLGKWYLKNMAMYLAYTYMGVAKSSGKDFYRFWLGQPIMSDEQLFQKLVPSENETTTLSKLKFIPGLNDVTSARMEFLLSDQQTNRGMVNFTKRYCLSERNVADRNSNDHPNLGWSSEYRKTLPSDMTDISLGNPGLVEAALWHAVGAIQLNLFKTHDGIAMIQKVLENPLGGYLLMRVGASLTWRGLETMIEDHEDQWKNWRDVHNNNIAHWLSYGFNKIDKEPRAKAHRNLGKKFPDLMTSTNDQGYTPTDFMPQAHADAIALKIITKTGKRSRTEQRAAPNPKIRTI
jgi:hypothetical protein